MTINTEDEKARGIKNGDLVRAYNVRGQILVGALVSDGIKLGAVCVHEGAWPDQDENGLCHNDGPNIISIVCFYIVTLVAKEFGIELT